MKTNYKNIVSALGGLTEYHDDMYDEEVKFLDFPYSRLFGDFRIFNGMDLNSVDILVGEFREIMIRIANIQAIINKEGWNKNDFH